MLRKMKSKTFSVRFMAEAGVIAAVYFVLTIAVAPLSYGQIQMRVSEALCILPFFTPAAIPGLFIGCVFANLVGGFGIIDIVFGSLATLIAAFITYKIKNKWLLPLPSVIVNALTVGAILYYVLQLPFWISVLFVGAGQAIACYVLGMPLFFLLNKHKNKLFKRI